MTDPDILDASTDLIRSAASSTRTGPVQVTRGSGCHVVSIGDVSFKVHDREILANQHNLPDLISYRARELRWLAEQKP